MDTKQLEQGLHQAFFTEKHRLVFWYGNHPNTFLKSKVENKLSIHRQFFTLSN
jgi:hypothetical protein